MKKNRLPLIFATIILSMSSMSAQKRNAPIMGWSSWNHFQININEQMIKGQADAMIASGLYDAGYRFINIDDGYFGGRDADGKLLVDKVKFPSGMKSLTEYVHSKKLKAGIYTDGGKDTCGSMYNNDSNGKGSGINGHIEQDCNLFFKEWKFDFLKVDWCGGDRLKLDEETEYSKIMNAVKTIDPNIVFNICRWQFPGVWAIKKADSWRMSGDIQATFSSILKIIDINADLYQYSSPGHFNDMDMLQVGRGMSYEEDKTHFSMWCMLNSPLLAGNDLRDMTKQTIEILTNKEVIALNQDTDLLQAKKVFSDDKVDVWIKTSSAGKKQAIAILNRSDVEKAFKLDAEKLNIDKKSKIRDLWLHNNLGEIGSSKTFSLAKHGIVVLKID